MLLAKVVASGTKVGIPEAGITAILGYAVVFFGLALLMAVVIVMGKIMSASKKKEVVAAAPEKQNSLGDAPAAPAAPGSAGKLKLYDTPERDAAMIMAIVADKLGKPLNELRFISIKEVK